jgi:hypothetical protein
MNCNKFIRGVAILCASSFLWVSCQKENIDTPQTPTETQSNLRLSGVVPDDPALVAKVPMITSADFMAGKITNYFGYQPQTESAKAGGSTGRDRTTPVVNITTPTTGSTVSNTVSVQVSASDNVGVSSVVLKVDGIVIGSSSASPYNFSWNTSGLSSGTHTLTATASDAAGNSKISSIQVGYNTPASADITPPTLNITSPTNGAAVSSSVTVDISAGDNVGVSSVSFQVDGSLMGTDNSAPYSFSWNASSVAAGVHTLTALGTDAAGNTNSSSIQVTVNSTVLPPTPIPTSFQLVTPAAGNQGNEGNCVGFSVAYGARSIEQYYRTNATSYSFDSNIFSPEYVYNQTKFSDCGSGTSLITVLDLLVSQGVSTWQSMPYSDVNGCSLQPTSAQVSNASGYKISSYSLIPNTDQTAIKTMIASKHPVIVTLLADNSFINAGPGFIWKTSVAGTLRHCVVICGYDDAKHAYKVMNSFGTAWGDAGFSWIDYDLFPQKSTYDTYVIQ